MSISTAVNDPVRRFKPETTAALHELLRRIEREYQEMPSLSLTASQARRLWGLDTTTCTFVLVTLIQRGILMLSTNGTYIRASTNA